MSYQRRLFSVISLLVVISMLASPIAALAAPMSGRSASEASAPAAADAPAPAASELAAPQPASPAAQLQAGVNPNPPPTINPLVRVRQYNGYDVIRIEGWWPVSGNLTVYVEDPLGGVTSSGPFWATQGNRYWRNVGAIADGSTITVTGGGVTQVVYVDYLTGDEVDPDSDTVSGVFAGLPNTPLRVAVDGVEKNATTDGSGAFAADFSGMVDIDWNDVATIYTTNADGNQVYYERGAKLVRVRWDEPNYDAWNVDGYWPVDAFLTFELQHAGGVETRTVNAWAGSRFSRWFSNQITDTAVITISDGVITDVIDVAAATDVTLDSYAESVGATLAGIADRPVTVYWQNVMRNTTTNGSGVFSVDFLGEGDVAVGDTLAWNQGSYLYYTDGAQQVYYSNVGRAYGVRTRWASGYNVYYVDGYLPTLNVPVTVTKQSPAYVNTDAALDWDGRFQVYMGGVITDTNTITATDGATTRTVNTPRITALGNYVENTVSGTGPAGARLRVYVDTWPYDEQDVTVQANGTWDITTTVNLGTGSSGWVRYTEPDGDEVYYYWRVALTQINLYNWTTPALQGYFPIPNHPVSITLWSEAGMHKGGTWYTTGWNGWYSANFAGVPVEEGDTIRVTDGTTTQEYAIPTAFNGVGDANSDTVSGQVSAATNITDTTGNVYPNLLVYPGTGASGYVTTTATGDFIYATTSDLRRGHDGYLRYIDAEGTYFYRNITVPGINYSVVNNTWIEGYFPRSGVPVTATLYSVTDTFKSYFTAVARGSDNYFYDTTMWTGFTQTVQMGDLIEVEDSEDGVLISLRVPTVTVHSNQATDLVNGVIETSAGGVEVDNTDTGKYPLLWVGTNSASGWRNDYVTSTTGGAFTFDPGADIQPGDSGRVEYTDAQGNWVRYPDFYAHGIRVQDGDYRVRGEGFLPSTTITVTQSDDPGNDQTTTSNAQGYFNTWFSGFANTFDPGDTITVTDGANTYVVTVPDLQIRAYAGSDKVFGSGLNSKLEVTLSGDGTYREVTDLGGGAWMLDLSGEDDFDIGEYVRYRYTDNNHNQVYHTGNNYPVGETDTAQVRWSGSGYDADRLRGYFPGWTAGNITATLHATDGSYRDQRVDTTIGVGGFYDVSFGVAEIQDGDFITVTDGVDVIRIDVPVYTVDGLDYAVDRITGTLAYTDGVNPVQAGGAVTGVLRAINTNYNNSWLNSAFFNADANGVYDLDMSATPRGIYPGDNVRYLYVDGAGNEVYFDTEWLRTTDQVTTSGEIRWYAYNSGSMPSGYYDANYIRGYWSQTSVNVTASFSTTTNTYSDWADANGSFAISSPWWHYFSIQNGEVITLTDGIDTVVIPIADVQVDVDADADTVTVSGLPADKAAQVQLNSSGQWTVTNVTADGAGRAVADFGALNTDIEDGDEGYVVYDPHGFAIYTPFNVTVYEAPQVDVYGYETRVYVDAQKNIGYQPYTMTLRTGSVEKDQQTGSTWFNSAQNISFGETIEPGDTVDVTVLYPDGVERSTSVYVDPAFTVEDIDFVADTVTVSAPAGITGTNATEFPYLWVNLGTGQYVTDTTGSTTTYVADDLGDLGRNAGGEVWHANSEGNRVGIWANNPIYRVYQHSDGDDARGYTLLPRTDVQATLYDESDQIRAQARVESDGGGWFWIDFEDTYGYDLQIEPGDTVELDVEGEGVTTIEVPTLTGMADFALDTVSGVITGPGVTFPITGTNNDHAPSLRVHGQYVTPTVGSGIYLAENLGLIAGEEGQVRYVRNDGHEVYAYWRAPQLQVRHGGSGFEANRVRGHVPHSQYVTVTLRLLDRHGSVRDVEYFRNDGWFTQTFVDVYGNDVDIENGDTVEMIVEGHTWAVTVPDPFYAEADYVGDTVFGQVDGAANFTATANITESVYINGFGIDAVVETDADGNFSAAGNDFGPTERGYVRYRDTQGFEVYQQAIAPWAMIELGGNRVDGSVVRPNVPVAVTLTDSADAFKDDEQATSNNNGMFAVEFEDNLGNDVIIEGGDQVEIIASPPIVVDVPTIVVSADADTNIISGEISVPVGQNQPSVYPNLYIKLDVGSGLYRWITTTASSPYTFEYDFGGVYDLQDGDTGEVRYTNAEGHQIYVNFTAEADEPLVNDQTELYLRQNNVYEISGWVAYANADVTLRLEDAFGNVKGTRTVTADGSGGFDTTFLDAAANDVPIRDGDTVRVTSQGTAMAVTVPTMTGLTADYETDAVSGVITGTVVDHPLIVTPREVTYTNYLSGTGAFAWTDITATTGITLTGFTDLDDGYTDTVPLGFDFEFYGQVYTQAIVATNGFLGFGSTSGFDGYQTTPITDGVAPNNFIAPFATDLDLSTVGHVYYTMTGTSPNRIFTVQWDGVEQLNTGLTQTFQALLYEGSNLVKFQYGTMHAPNDVTLVGVENMTGTLGTQYWYTNTGTALGPITDSLAVVFTPTAFTDYYWQEVPALSDRLFVEVHAGGSEYVTTTLTGAFDTLNGPSYGDPPDDVEALGINPLDTGYVRFTNVVPNAGNTDWAQRHHVFYDFAAEDEVTVHTPELSLRQSDDADVAGRVAYADESVTLELYRGSDLLSSVTLDADANGYFDTQFTDSAGSTVTIADGDRVEVTSLDTTIVYTLPTLSGLVTDPVSDTVSGQLTGLGVDHPITTAFVISDSLYVEVNGAEYVTTTAAGLFSTAHISSAGDVENVGFTYGDAGYILYTNRIADQGALDELHRVYYHFTVPDDDLVFEALRVRGHTSYAMAEANYGGRDVTFYLYDETNTLIDEQSDNGASWGDGDYDVYFPNATVQPGYTVKVVADENPTISRAFTVPSLAITSVDTFNDVVTGTASFTETFEVNWDGGMSWNNGALSGGTTRDVIPVAGTWSADFFGDQNLQPGNTGGHLLYTAPDGNQLYQRYAAQQITVYKDTARVTGPVYNGGVTVTMTLLDSAGNIKDTEVFRANANGYFSRYFRDIYGNDVYMHAGDRVVIAASDPVTIEIPALSAWADWYEETVVGTSSLHGETINVDLAGCASQSVVVDGTTGFYSANFAGLCDLTAGQPGHHVYYLNADGNRVRLDFTVPDLHVRRYWQWGWLPTYNENYISGYTAAGTEVTVTAQLADAASGEVKGTAMTTWGVNSHGQYNFQLYDEYGNPTPILPGDTITVTETAGIGVRTQFFTVPEMTANTDLLADTVSGQMGDQANTAFEINVAGNTDTITTTTGGAYTANFAPVYDIDPGDYVRLDYADTDHGRWFYFENRAPIVYVRTSNGTNYMEEWVAGYTNSDAEVLVTLWRNGSLLASKSTTAAGDGSYAVQLTDNAGNGVEIEDGDAVIVQTENGTTRVDVADVDFTPDVATQTVTGSGIVTGDELEIYFGGIERTALDVSGTFTATFPDGTFDYSDYGYAHYLNSDQNLVHYEFYIPVTEAFVRVIEGPYTDDSGNDWNVGGYVPVEDAEVTVTLLDDVGAVKSTAYVEATNHQFGAMLEDSYGHPIEVMAGDTVRVESESMTALEVTVPAMEIYGDAYTDAVTGSVGAVNISQTGLVTNSILANYGDGFEMDAGDTFNSSTTKAVTATGGEFETIISGLPSGETLNLRYTDNDGNEFYTVGESTGVDASSLPPSKLYAPFNEALGATTFSDLSGNGNDGVCSGGSCPIAGVAGHDGTALDFDGVDDYVNFGSPADLVIANYGSISAWIYPTGPGSHATAGGIIVNKEYDYEVARFSDGTLRWAFDNANPGWTFVNVNTGVYVPLNQWTHVVVVYDAGTIRTYVDGTLEHTYYGSGAISNSNAQFRVGGRQVGNQYFDGAIDEVYVFNQALDQDDVTYLYDGTVPMEDHTPIVRAWVGDYQVGGLSPLASEAVTITLTAADGTVKSIETDTADGVRYFHEMLTDSAGDTAFIEPGDTVTVEFGESDETVTLDIEDPFTLYANATDDTIYGNIGALDIAASPYITDSFILNVGAWSLNFGAAQGTIPLNGGSNQAVAVATGFYTTTWPSNFNASDPVWAIYTNDAGHQQILQIMPDADAPPPTQARVTVHANENYVGVIHPQSNEPVTATLTRNGVQIAEGARNGNGDITLVDVYGQAVYIQAGDLVQVDFETDEGLQTYTVTVPELSALANYQDNTISGIGPAGEELEVFFEGGSDPDVERTVFPNPNYSVDLTGLTDIEPGESGRLYYIITDTDEIKLDVYLDFRAPQATAHLGQTTFSGHTAFSTLYNATPVTATLYRNGEIVGYTAFMANGDYYEDLCDVYGNCDNDQGNAAAMRPGDELVIAARGEPEIRITLPELAAIADHNADIVTGESNLPDTDIEVHMNGTEQTVRTGADGAFTADFSAPPFANDFGRGTTGYIYYLTPEGHRVYLNVRAPFVRAYLGTNHAYAHVATNFNVTGTLSLKDSGGALKAQTSFNSSNNLHVYFYDEFGNPVFIAAGDTLELDVPNDDPITLDVPTLTAQADAATDEVAITAPAVQSTKRPSATLELSGFPGGDRMLTSDTTSYTVWDRDWDIVPGEDGTLIYTNANGDEVYLDFVTPIVRVHASSEDVTGNTVSGYAQPDKLVAVALVRGGATLWSGADESNNSGWFSLNTGVDIEAGDTIAVQGGGLNASVDVVALDATVDYEEETVTGVGPADVTITDPLHALWVNSDDESTINFNNATNRYTDGATQAVTTTAAGAFTADFSGMSGAANSAGDRAELRYTNAAGHQVYAQFEAKQAAPTGKIEIWQGMYTGNVIHGTAGERNAVVWVTLYDSDGATEKASFRTTSDGNGWFDVDDSELQDEYGNPVVIEGGDYVKVETLDWSTTIEVTPLSAMADVEADTVAGVGPANITDLDGDTTFQVEMDGVRRAVTTTATGDFEAVFFDISMADSGELTYTTPDYVLRRRFYAPGYNGIHIGTPNAEGNVTDPGIAVTVELSRAGDIIGGWEGDANSSGYFSADLRDATGAPVYIQPDDEVSLSTDAGESWSVAVPPLDISADPATNIVTGHAPDGERVRVRDNWNSVWRDATAFGGVYEYDFTGRRNVQARDLLQVAYRQDQGDAQVWFFAHGSVPGAEMQLYDNWLYALVATGRALVSYEVRNAAGEQRMQDTTLASVYGSFSVNLVDAYGNGVNLLPGDQIIITAGETFTYTVPALTALADVNADTVSGSGPADTQVRVCIGYCQTVWTDGSGAFTANFQGRDNITAGETGWLTYRDAEGNWYYLNFSAPSLNIQYQGDPTDGSYVYGHTSMPLITYTLELERGGSVIARMSGQSGGSGSFSHYLDDFYGNPLLTEDGDVVILYEEGIEVNRATVHALSALVDIFADTVTGIGPADSELEVDASYDKTVATDGSGAYMAANPFYSGGNEAYQNFNAGDTGTLRYYHSDGDQIYYNFTAPYLEVHAAFHPGVGSNNTYNAGYVNGGGWPAGRPVVLTLYDSGGDVKDTETLLGAFTDEYGNGVEILGGDRIEAQVQGMPAMEVTVPTVDAHVDLEADVVSGTFTDTVAALPVHPAGSLTHTLELAINWQYFGSPWWQWRYEYEHAITTTAAGAFEHRFADETPIEEINPGQMGELRYSDHNANVIHLRFEAPREQLREPQVNAQLYETRAWGWVLLERVPVTVTLRRAGVALDIWTSLSSDSGYFNVYFSDDTYNNAIVILPGDQIVVEAHGMDAITLDVPDLTVDPDAAADTVAGTAPDGGDLEISLAGTLYPEISGGTWLADFRANDHDFAGGDSGALTYTNADGHVVYLNFNVPVVTADLYRSGIYVVNLYPNMPITATLTNGAGNVKAQAETLAAVGYGADLYFYDRFNQPVNILPGDTVTVYPYGAAPRVLNIVEMDASANPETDQVTGVGPAGETLQVAMGGAQRSVIPAADGSFTFDFTGLYDISAGNTGSLRYYLSAQGDAQELSFAAPVVWVRAGEGSNEGRVHGHADRAGRDVRVEVVRGGNVVATALGSATPSFNLTVRNIYANVVAIQPGDTVNVSFDGAPIPVDVPGTALDAEIDVDGNTVTVSGPDGATVEFDFAGFPNSSARQRTVVLSGGSATIDYAGYHDIGAGATGYVHWRDANGNSVYVNVADPVINVYQYRTYIAGYVNATDGLVRVRLLRGGEEVASSSSDINSNGRIGNYDRSTCPSEFSYRCLKFYDKFGQQMLILPGDTVEITAPDDTVTTIAVEELWAKVDVANDALTVRGPADEEIKIEFSSGFSENTARGLFSSHTIVATGGNQVIEYADPSDPTRDVIRSGAYGWLRYYNDEGHRIHRYFRASQVWVYQGQNRVRGYATQNGADILVELVRGGNVIASVHTEADTNSFYEIFFTADDAPVIIEQGDTVRVTEGNNAPIDVPAALSAQVDTQRNTVTGDAPGPVQVTVSGSSLTVWPEGGVYTADFTGRRDIQGGSTGQLAYLNAAGHTVYLNFAAPYIQAELGSNYVDGYVDRGTNVAVDVELIRGGSRIAAETVIADSSSGYFYAYLVHADGTRAIIRPGDTVRVTANGQTREVAVQALTADADEVANTISGIAPNGEVYLLDSDGITNTVIASGGTYNASYGNTDFRSGAHWTVWYQEADGDRVFRAFSTPYIAAEVGGNTVRGDVAYKYITVTVQIERGGGIIAEAEAFVNTHYFSFHLVDAQGAAIVLQNGDIVHVHAADAVVNGDGDFSDGDLTIRTLTANVNVAADTVSGSAPNGLVWVEVNDNAQDVIASGGSYSADFSGVYDIQPGDRVFVGYYDAEHDLGYINAYGDQIIVWEGTDRIEGYVPEGGQLVEISVTSGGAEVGFARVWAAWDGNFSARVTRADDENTPYLIQPNDVVQVTNGAWSASVAAVPLTAEIDTANDQVDVAGPAGAAVNVYVNNYNKLVTLSGGSGAATNPFFNSSRGIHNLDLTPGDTGYVRYLDANGHEVRRTFAAPQINARLSNNEIWGYVNGGKQLVTIILADAEGEKGRAYDWTNDYGNFDVYLLDDMGHDVIILPDDTVTVQVGGNTVRTMTVAELTAIANPETSQVAGTAPAGRVNVAGQWAEVAPDGTYRHISGYTTGDVYYPDANDNRTYLSFQYVGLHVREMGKQVFGYVPVAEAIVEVQLVAFGREGESVKVRSGSNGYIDTRFGSNYIKPGDMIKIVIEGQPDIRIPVPLLEATPFAATDIVTGTGPVNSELNVYHRYHSDFVDRLSSPFARVSNEARTVRTDANGNFTANFAADNLRADVIEGGEYGYVSYTNEDGHTVYRSYRVPLIRIDITNDTAEMFTEAFTQWRGAHFIGGDAYSGLFERVKADQDGHLITYLWDANENPLDINAGDEVWLLPEGGDVATELITVTIPASFTVAISPTTNLVYGEAPANAHLRVRAFHWQDSPVLNHARGGWTSRDMIVQANGAGRYSADFSGYLDLVDYDYAYVYYQTEPGIELVVGTLNHENSPLLGEIEHALAGELHGLESFFVDTANRGEVSTFYYTPTRNNFILGIDWGGSGAFEVTMTGPLGSITETHTFNLNAASAPTMVKMDVPVTGAPWRIDVKATSVSNDTFYYNLFTGYYTGIGQIYLPIVAKNH